MDILFRISLVFKFLFDKNIPLKEKWWIIIPVIYMFSPLDLIPEPIIGFGFIDDIIVLGFLLSLVNSKTKKYYDENSNIFDKKDVKNEKIIENVEYEVKDDEEQK